MDLTDDYEMEKKTTVENLINNVRMLLDARQMTVSKLSEKSGVTSRMINFILNSERKPSIEVADKIARGFGLTGWQLLIPDLKEDLIKSGHLDDLICNYEKASDEGRKYIERVAEQEAVYGTTQSKS